MSYYVDNFTGLVTGGLSTSIESDLQARKENKAVFQDRTRAEAYAKTIIEKNKDDPAFESTRKLQIWSFNFRNPLNLLIYIPYLIVTLFSRILMPICKAPFKKHAKISDKIIGWIVIILLIGFVSYGSLLFYNKLIKINGYVTTKISILEYSKKEKTPDGKEIGKLKEDQVLKIENIYKNKETTWINVYKLDNGQPVKTWIYLPEVVKVNEENKYLIFNKNSKTWNSYYEKIDLQNKPILENIQTEFKESIKDIKIEYSKDNTKKETIKSTSFIFVKEGYLGLYKTGENDFYYIDKKDKTEFLKALKNAEKSYENQKIRYFPDENKLKEKLLLK